MKKQELNSDVSGTERFLRGRRLVVLPCLLVAGLWLLAHVALTNAAPLLAPDATVSLSPNTQVVDLGEHFTVDVMIDEYSDLGGYEFDLSYDSSVVNGENAEDGGLLESSGRTMVEVDPPLLSIDNGSSPGRLSFAELTYGDNGGPTGTDGNLATVQLKATDLHSTTLDLDGVLVVDTQGVPQPIADVAGGTVLVNTTLNGKFNDLCQAQRWGRRQMDLGERTDPPGPGTVDCRDYDHVMTGSYAYKITGSPTKKKMLKQNINVTGGAGETFKLSGWSYVTSDTFIGWQAYKLVVRVTYTDDSWEEHQVIFSPLPEDFNTWQYREVEFMTADSYKKLELFVKFFEKPETAIAWFDDIQLVRQSDNWDAITNGSFEGLCQAQRWGRRKMDLDERIYPPGPGTVDCRDYDHVMTGSYAYKITGSPTKKKMLKQNINVTGGAGETFKLSGWSYVTSDTFIGWQAYKLVVRVTYTDDSWEEHQVIFSPLPEDFNTWQYREVEFATTDAYKKFEVFVKFFEKPETAIAWFDDIRLVRQ